MPAVQLDAATCALYVSHCRRPPVCFQPAAGFWTEVSKRMRAAEKAFKPSFRETRAAYIARLKRTAMSVPARRLRQIIGSMTRRCRAVATIRTTKGSAELFRGRNRPARGRSVCF